MEMKPNISLPEPEQIVLERMKVAAIQHLPRYLAEEAELTAYADYFGDMLALRLESEVLGKSIGQKTVSKTVTWEEPKSWVHAVLDRFFPLWAKTVARSRTVELVVDYKVVFPDAQVRFPPNLGHPTILAFPQEY